nr:hypothetical protein [Candidatus Sigynarchaeota archaeon]
MLFAITSLDQFYSFRTLLLIVFIGILLVGFVWFMVKARTMESPQARRIQQGYGLFGLTYAFTRIFFLLSDYERGSHLGTVTQLHLIWVGLGYSVTFVSLLVIYYTVEKQILNRKPILTVIALGSFIVCLVSLVMVILNIGVDLVNNNGPQKIAQYTLYITGSFLAIGIAALYIVIARNSSGDVKKKALLSLIGLLIMFGGLLMDMDALSALGIDAIRFYLSPLLFIVGTSMFFVAQRK